MHALKLSEQPLSDASLHEILPLSRVRRSHRQRRCRRCQGTLSSIIWVIGSARNEHSQHNFIYMINIIMIWINIVKIIQ